MRMTEALGALGNGQVVDVSALGIARGPADTGSGVGKSTPLPRSERQVSLG
jgi:hypothetical protein